MQSDFSGEGLHSDAVVLVAIDVVQAQGNGLGGDGTLPHLPHALSKIPARCIVQHLHLIQIPRLVDLLNVKVADAVRLLHGHAAVNAEPCHQCNGDHRVVAKILQHVLGEGVTSAIWRNLRWLKLAFTL